MTSEGLKDSAIPTWMRLSKRQGDSSCGRHCRTNAGWGGSRFPGVRCVTCTPKRNQDGLEGPAYLMAAKSSLIAGVLSFFSAFASI